MRWQCERLDQTREGGTFPLWDSEIDLARSHVPVVVLFHSMHKKRDGEHDHGQLSLPNFYPGISTRRDGSQAAFFFSPSMLFKRHSLVCTTTVSSSSSSSSLYSFNFVVSKPDVRCSHHIAKCKKNLFSSAVYYFRALHAFFFCDWCYFYTLNFISQLSYK